jgi:hypothetical protein
MGKIASSSDLKIAIQQVSIAQVQCGKQLKTQLLLTYENLQPVSILKSVMNEAAASPNFIESIVGSLMGLLGGYLSKKISVGTSDNPFRKLIGSALQFTITSIVALHPNAIMSIGKFVLRYMFREKNKFNEIA